MHRSYGFGAGPGAFERCRGTYSVGVATLPLVDGKSEWTRAKRASIWLDSLRLWALVPKKVAEIAAG